MERIFSLINWKGNYQREHFWIIWCWFPWLLLTLPSPHNDSSFHFLKCSVQFSSVQSLSRVRLFAAPWIAARQASLSITNSWSSLRLTSIESVMPSSHLILCCPLLLLTQFLPASESFLMSQLFAWGGQSTGLSSFLPKKSHGWSPSEWTGWISLQSNSQTIEREL